MHHKLSLAAALCLCAAAAAQAQDTTLDDRQLPLWEVGAFAGSASTPAYPGADERSTRTLALPYFVYRGKVLRADRDGIGARLLHTERMEVDVGFGISLPARSEDVAARRGMPDLGTLLEFGPRLKVALADLGENGRLRLEAPLRAVIEVNSGVRHQGFAFEPKLIAEMSDRRKLWNINASAGLVFGDSKLNNYFYQVRPEYATAERPAYRADAGFMMTRLGLSATRQVHPDWRLFGFLRHDRYAGAANRDSPLFRRDSGTSAGVGVIWTWRRSAELAR